MNLSECFSWAELKQLVHSDLQLYTSELVLHAEQPVETETAENGERRAEQTEATVLTVNTNAA